MGSGTDYFLMNLKISKADVTGLPEEKKETREKDGKIRIAGTGPKLFDNKRQIV